MQQCCFETRCLPVGLPLGTTGIFGTRGLPVGPGRSAAGRCWNMMFTCWPRSQCSRAVLEHDVYLLAQVSVQQGGVGT